VRDRLTKSNIAPKGRHFRGSGLCLPG